MPNNNRTFGELQSAIQTEMQLDPGLISQTERQTFINDCMKDLGKINLFEKDVELDIVNGEVTLPDDFVDLIDVFYGQRELVPMENAPTYLTTGSPVGYILKYNKMNVYPAVASGKAKLFYAYKPALLVLDADRPDLPNGWDYLIVDFAVAKCYRKNGQIGLYREYMAAYNDSRGDLVQELTRRQNSRVTSSVVNNDEYNGVISPPEQLI